jgi:hypothetical protein
MEIDVKKANRVEAEVIPYESVSVPAGRIRITVEGIKPLLTHNPASMSMGGGTKRGTNIPDPEVEAERGVYRMEDGTCALKGEAFRGSLLGAASAWLVKKASLATKLSHVVAIEELVPLVHPADDTPIKNYVIDRRRVIVQGNGIVRARPRFDEWKTSVTFEYDSELVNALPEGPKIFADVLADAGQRMGVGDYRPQRVKKVGGPFGRYRVVEYCLL